MKLDVKLLTKYLEEVVITLHYCHKWENSMNKKCYLLVCIIILVSFYVCVCSCVTSWLQWSCRSLRCCWENTDWDQTLTTSALSCCNCMETTASSCCWVRDVQIEWNRQRERERELINLLKPCGIPQPTIHTMFVVVLQGKQSLYTHVCVCMCEYSWCVFTAVCVNHSFLFLSERERRIVGCFPPHTLLILSVLYNHHCERFSGGWRRKLAEEPSRLHFK